MRRETHDAVNRPRAGELRCRAALVAIVIALPGRAAAEGAGAAELFRQGVDALQAGELREAESLFRLSYEMDPSAATMCNLALTYDRSGDRRGQALEAYRRCAEEDVSGRFRDHALGRAQEIRAELEAERPLSAGDPGAGETSPGPTGPQPQPQQPAQDGTTQISGSATVAVQQPAPEPPRRSRAMLWTGVATGVLALGSLGGALGLHLWADSIYDGLSTDYPDRQIESGTEDADWVDTGRSAVRGAIALYVIGGIAAGLSTLLIALDLTRASRGTPLAVGASPLDGGFAFALRVPLL